jgi:hypothetical protein
LAESHSISLKVHSSLRLDEQEGKNLGRAESCTNPVTRSSERESGVLTSSLETLLNFTLYPTFFLHTSFTMRLSTTIISTALFAVGAIAPPPPGMAPNASFNVHQHFIGPPTRDERLAEGWIDEAAKYYRKCVHSDKSGWC